MASSGTSSGTSSLMKQNSGSDEDAQVLNLADQRKRKRMISNRESARRSRMRKQKHLDDLTAQIAQLIKENHQIITTINITTQHYMSIEADNSVLRAQVDELSHRLQSLNEIISFLNDNNGVSFGSEPENSNFNIPLTNMSMAYLNQPIMASADMFQF